MRRNIVILSLAAGCLLIGCKTPVVFTTHTSLGLDVSGTTQMPNKVSFSYNRFEGAIVPRKTNGESHSVYGGMDADIKFFDSHTIKQTFATGKAAMLATGADTKDINYTSKDTNQAALVFVTATTFGLHLAAGEEQMSPNMLLGYRRTEATMISVPDPAQEVRSVYADLLINSSSHTNNTSITTNFSSLNGVRIKQSFATGRAADALAAKNAEVRQNLEKAAGLSASAQLTGLRAEGKSLADEVADLIDKLPPDKLDAAGQAAVDTKLFTSLDGFSNLTAEKKAEQLKAVTQDRRSPRDIEKVKQFKTRLQTLQPE